MAVHGPTFTTGVGGRFHVRSGRRPIFRRDTERYRFLKLLSQLPERFGTRIHGYVLMDNHASAAGDARPQPDPLHAMAESLEFARQILGACQGNPREQRALRRLDPVVPWDRIILAVERVKGDKL